MRALLHFKQRERVSQSLCWSLVETEDGAQHLVYTDNVSKYNPGGLHNRNLKPKVVIHHANLNNPSRCFVTFYKAYVSHRIQNPKSDIWYSMCPVGYRTLSNNVNRLCKLIDWRVQGKLFSLSNSCHQAISIRCRWTTHHHEDWSSKHWRLQTDIWITATSLMCLIIRVMVVLLHLNLRRKKQKKLQMIQRT